MKKISARAAYDGCRNCCAVHGIVSCIELHSSRGRRISVSCIRSIDNSAVFTPAAIPGLFIGCLLSNLITGALPYDLVFGSLATLIGAIGTFALRKLGENTSRTLPGGMPLGAWLAPLPRLQQTRSSCRLLSQKYLKCRSRFRCSRSPFSSAKLCAAADSGCCCLPH